MSQHYIPEGEEALYQAAPDMLDLLNQWLALEQEAHFEEQAHEGATCVYCATLALVQRVRP